MALSLSRGRAAVAPAQRRAHARAWPADASWLLGASAALILLCSLPYALATWFGPSDLEHIGTFWFMRDFSQYQAAMREGASQSGWLIHDHLSAEDHSAEFVYQLYVAAGKLSALMGLGNLTVFAVLEWLGRLAVLGGAYAFAATFLKPRRQRRLAVLLTLGALGLDALAAALRLLLDGAGLHALDGLLPDTIDPYLE